MHFLHGIRQAFAQACGGSLNSSCLPILDLLTNDLQSDEKGPLLPVKISKGEENDAVNTDLQQTIEGDLLPLKGEENDAVNTDLQQTIEGDLLPLKGEEDEAVCNLQKPQPQRLMDKLPPTRGDEEEDKIAANSDLQQDDEGYCPSQKAVQNLQIEKGGLLPQNVDDGCLPSMQQGDDGAFRPSIGVPSYHGEFFPSLLDYPQFEVMHDSKHHLLSYMHVQIGRFAITSMVHEHIVNDHAKPRVDPKVKKKTSLLLCLTINMPFHPGEYGHDGSPPPHSHHDPYSMILSNDVTLQATLMVAYIITMFTYQDAANHQASTCLTTTNSSSFPDSAENEDITSLSFAVHILRGSVHGHDDELQTDLTSVYLLFTPLRGRNKYQGHEKHDQLKTPCVTSLKMKTRMQMEIFYLTKDVFDPG